MEGTDICFAPVLNMAEAPEHPHNKARDTFIELEGIVQPAPAPRFSITTPEAHPPPAYVGEHTDEVLTDIGIQESDIEALKSSGEIA
jgi:alpha-methylacyl-CoA racemase